MIDKDSEIERLTNLTKFLKSKLDECLKGNITSDPIVNKIIAKHIKRHNEGMANFGKTMADNNKPLNEWIKDAQEESMDQILYLEKILKKD
tara:strand:+ start:55 stop:327 length:273 start_codon:yes stop_codon:yes gene_type:complete